jgi:hypothetical protein
LLLRYNLTIILSETSNVAVVARALIFISTGVELFVSQPSGVVSDVNKTVSTLPVVIFDTV